MSQIYFLPYCILNLSKGQYSNSIIGKDDYYGKKHHIR
jgi:hypothetical protein